MFQRRLYINILLLTIIFSCTGCFDVIENLTINADGSGKMKMIFNMSKSKSELDIVMSKDSIYNLKVPSVDSLNRKFGKLESVIRSNPGISNVQILKDYSQFKFTVKFDFKRVSNLQNALNCIIQLRRYGDAKLKKYITCSYSTAGFKRTNTKEALGNVNKKISWWANTSFRNARYTGILKFDKMIKNSSNSKAQISKTRKSVLTRIPIMTAISSPAATSQNVTF